uniref:Uncharacterized protein n=1 Tax=Schizaphis graminum TaxID=13262 RepID=A0A2S2NSP9_SCHGA
MVLPPLLSVMTITPPHYIGTLPPPRRCCAIPDPRSKVARNLVMNFGQCFFFSSFFFVSPFPTRTHAESAPGNIFRIEYYTPTIWSNFITSFPVHPWQGVAKVMGRST